MKDTLTVKLNSKLIKQNNISNFIIKKEKSTIRKINKNIPGCDIIRLKDLLEVEIVNFMSGETSEVIMLDRHSEYEEEFNKSNIRSVRLLSYNTEYNKNILTCRAFIKLNKDSIEIYSFDFDVNFKRYHTL